MATRRFVMNITTAADGTFNGFSPFASGKICSIHYIKTNFADGVDFTVTAEATGETIWTEANVNAAKVVMPRGATASNAGVAALYAAGGTAVLDHIRVSRDRIRVQIAQGGNATTGQLQFVLED